MLKKTIKLIIVVLFVSSCTASLVDLSNNSFTAYATRGEFEDKIVLKWTPQPFYSSYIIYKSDSELGEYVKISDKIVGSEFTDTDIQAGKSFYYTIEAYNQVDYPFYLTDAVEGYAGAEGGFFPPASVQVHSGEFIDKIRITWSRVTDATTYQIWRSEDNLSFELIGDSQYMHFIDTSVQSGKDYFYQVSSMKGIVPSSGRSLSQKGRVFSGNINLVVSAGQFHDKIQLTWSKIPYATSYDIYRSENTTSKGDKKASKTQEQESNFTDENLTVGSVYYYTIVYKNNSALLESSSVRGYTSSSTAPAKPQTFSVSQGTSKSKVSISWSAVENATAYELERSVLATGPWTLIYNGVNTLSEDILPSDNYVYYYRVTPKNSAFGIPSDIKAGWALKAPMNLTASQIFTTNIDLKWDEVPDAESYVIYISESATGTFTELTQINKQNSSYSYSISLGSQGSKSYYFKISVITPNGESDQSSPIKGTARRVDPPSNITIQGNRTPTKSMMLVWNHVSGASGYRIYKATLAHTGADPSRVRDEDFKVVTHVQNNSYTIVCNTYPIRRYIYKIASIDRSGYDGEAVQLQELVWRLPEDVADFLKDVDFSILQAQKQIPNFGGLGSQYVVLGRYQGEYDYSAALGNIKNHWKNYIGFEIQLTGNPKMSVSFSPMGSYMDGPVNITGLYTGKVIYNRILGILGGYSTRGSISAEYQHPTQGLLTTNLTLNEAGILLDSVVLQTESKPSTPTFEAGVGI